MAEDFQAIRSAVDRLLLEQGVYSPVELLLAEGRLSFPDYEAWRCGQIATLEEQLSGNPARIRALLKQAGQYAEILGLRAERRDFLSWGNNAGRMLQVSTDAGFEDLCRTHYQRGGDEIQLDLFMDNSGNVLANGIVAALAARRAEKAARLVDQLLETDPSHPRLSKLDSLCNAMHKLSAPLADYGAELDYLEGYLAPLAAGELGAGARDFLAPFWRRLADALRGLPYTASMPTRHASYPLGRALDWSGVKAAVLNDAAWQAYPVMRLRLAEAAFHLGERSTALATWCRLCWDFPDKAAQAFAGGALPDKELRPDWERYCELEPASDREPEFDTPYFPAWLLLERTQTRDALAAEDAPQIHAPGRAYAALHELLAGGSALTEQTMTLRRELQQAHPGLFAIYMRSVVPAIR
ncbi:MAG: hypothetical protein WC091_17035 [Sulfuricellaceae bacterium]